MVEIWTLASKEVLGDLSVGTSSQCEEGVLCWNIFILHIYIGCILFLLTNLSRSPCLCVSGTAYFCSFHFCCCLFCFILVLLNMSEIKLDVLSVTIPVRHFKLSSALI